MRPILRKFLAGASIGVAGALVVLALAAGGLFDRVELSLYDWRMRQAANPAALNPDIVLVEINDTSINDYADAVGRWPWPRVLQSNLIDFLARGPARVIAYDVLLTEPTRGSFPFGDQNWTGAESDEAMATSIHDAGSVVLLADAVLPGTTKAAARKEWPSAPYHAGEAAEPRPVIVPPLAPLTNAAAGLAHNFLALDPDGVARRVPPFVQQDGRELPSLGVAAALAADRILPSEVSLDGDTLRIRDRGIPLVSQPVAGTELIPAHHQRSMLIDYLAPAHAYQAYEARHLLHAEDQILAGQKPDVDPALFRNKIVFVGLTASGLVDVFSTPFGDRGTMPGIQLHAAVADSILAKRSIRPASNASRVAAVVIAATSIGLLAAFLPFSAAAAASAAVLGGWTMFAVLSFRQGLWLNLSQPLAAGAIALFTGTAYRYLIEGRERRKISRLFGRYVSKDVYDHLLAHPESAELGGVRREMTVLFSDIRGFTTVTENGEPEALVAQLNEYFTGMVDTVFRYQGTLDKFVGDMVMALYGAPLEDPDHAEHAVRTAVEMIQVLGELNRKWVAAGGVPLDVGIGINSGDMIAGNIGSSAVMSYTVIGDNVNLGSRLESLNKDYKTRIIISDATRSRLTGTYDIRPLGHVTVKGKSRPVAIYEIRVPSPLVRPEGEVHV